MKKLEDMAGSIIIQDHNGLLFLVTQSETSELLGLNLNPIRPNYTSVRRDKNYEKIGTLSNFKPFKGENTLKTDGWICSKPTVKSLIKKYPTFLELGENNEQIAIFIEQQYSQNTIGRYLKKIFHMTS